MAIDFAQLREDLAAIPGALVAATKAQLDQLIDAAERGQAAERKLAELEKSSLTKVAA